jgi:hypothetical protein
MPHFIGKSTSQSPCPRAGLVALRQTFVRRCHGGLGSPGPAGSRPNKYDGTEVRAALVQSLRAALAGSMPASFHHAASLPRADCSSRPLWLAVRNKYWRQSTSPAAGQIHAPPVARPVTGQCCRSFPLEAQTAGKTRMRTVVQTIIVALAVACCASACTQEQKAGCVMKGNISSPFAADYSHADIASPV